MKAKIIDLDNNQVSEIELNNDIFGQPLRQDILHRVVEWQRARQRVGSHKTKTISEVSGTGKKPYKQKGTGRARLGTLRANQCRGGGVVFGPLVRSHAYDLPKKIRKLGLKIALSSKVTSGKLLVVTEAKLADAKTKLLSEKLNKLGLVSKSGVVTSALIIEVSKDKIDSNILKASANIFNVNLLPTEGANVLDILKHDYLIITQEAIAQLGVRLA